MCISDRNGWDKIKAAWLFKLKHDQLLDKNINRVERNVRGKFCVFLLIAMSLVLLVVINNIVSVKYNQEIICNERMNNSEWERMKRRILVS